jgi:thioredoxin 1
MIAPVLEEIAAEHAGHVKIAKVNVDLHPRLAGQYKVRSIPTLLYFARGQVRDQLVGSAGKKVIVSRLAALSAGPREDDRQKN